MARSLCLGHQGILSSLWQVPWSHPVQTQGAVKAMVHADGPTTPRRAAGLGQYGSWTALPSSTSDSGSFQCCSCWTQPHSPRGHPVPSTPHSPLGVGPAWGMLSRVAGMGPWVGVDGSRGADTAYMPLRWAWVSEAGVCLAQALCCHRSKIPDSILPACSPITSTWP